MGLAWVALVLAASAQDQAQPERPAPRFEVRADALLVFPFGGRFWADERLQAQGGPQPFDLGDVGGERLFGSGRASLAFGVTRRDWIRIRFRRDAWSGGRRLGRTLGYDGKVLPAGTRVRMRSAVHRLAVGYERRWGDDAGWQLGLGLDAELVHYRFALFARGGAQFLLAAPGTSSTRADEDRLAILVPVLTVRLRRRVASRVWVEGALTGGASLNQGSHRASIVADRLVLEARLEAGVELGPGADLIFGLGYTDLRLRLREHRMRKVEQNYARFRFWGPHGGIALRF